MPNLTPFVSLTADQGGVYDEMAYKTIDDTVLRMRIYKPEGWQATDQRAAVVFFFGGGWIGGKLGQFDPYCRHLAELGMVAMTADYRVKRRHGSTPIESTRDAKSAMRWARANAGTLGIDPNRLAAGGGSSGGHLAAATATIGTAQDESSDDVTVSPVPNALILFNPALDLAIAQFRRRWGEEVIANSETISPFQHATASLPPTLIFHGMADTMVPYETITAFVDRVRGLGNESIVLEGYEGRDHGFFNWDRGKAEDCEDTVRKMDAFLAGLGWIEP